MPKKSFLTFWNMKGCALEHCQEKEQTVNSAAYSAMLKDKLKPAICHRRRGLLSNTAFLHHDNACSYVAVTKVETIQNLKFEVLPHPPYSPDLMLNAFHAFGPLTEALHGRWFGSDETVKEVMCT
jgi:histone-lysine N-methyltransferase SETMAR